MKNRIRSYILRQGTILDTNIYEIKYFNFRCVFVLHEEGIAHYEDGQGYQELGPQGIGLKLKHWVWYRDFAPGKFRMYASAKRVYSSERMIPPFVHRTLPLAGN